MKKSEVYWWPYIVISIYVVIPIVAITTESFTIVYLLLIPIIFKVVYTIAILLRPFLKNQNRKNHDIEIKSISNFNFKLLNLSEEYWGNLSQIRKKELIKDYNIKIQDKIRGSDVISKIEEVITNQKCKTMNSRRKNPKVKNEEEDLLIIGDIIKEAKSEAYTIWQSFTEVEKTRKIKNENARLIRIEVKEKLEKIEYNTKKIEDEKRRVKKEEELENRKRIQFEIERQNKIVADKKEIEKIKNNEKIKNKVRKEQYIKDSIRRKILEQEQRKTYESEVIQELLDAGLIDNNHYSGKHERESIPTNVKVAVWKRDKEKCVNCFSNSKLEFDHIIPVSKGGANTIKNIQLLCLSCNRKKGSKII
ncbi:HNH endonuclease [Flavobacterium ardleyense]|uniref:HNH endonuclease n=1 Tax=Flavobacterium ardleyense TaxID=2038737 RepID=A0ABW5ZB82_9FLAO